MYFYLTPILYPMSLILTKHPEGRFILLNPLGQVIQDLRYIMVTPQAETAWQQMGSLGIIPPVLIILLSIFAIKYFRKESKTFAENV